MISKIEIDYSELYGNLMDLLAVPGPTQACVKMSEQDPRINGNFPMEIAIEKLIKKFNKEPKVNLQVIRHNGNLVIVGGKGKYNKLRIVENFSHQEINDIKNIPIVFGAHLDEISYIVTKKRGFLEKDNRQIFPLCAPPKASDKKPIENNDKTLQAIELRHSEGRIVGFRDGNSLKILVWGLFIK